MFLDYESQELVGIEIILILTYRQIFTCTSSDPSSRRKVSQFLTALAMPYATRTFSEQ